MRQFKSARCYAFPGGADSVVSMDSAQQVMAPAEAVTSTDAPNIRIYSRHLMDMALLMVIAMLIAPTLNVSRTLFVDPDIWWHLANARIISTTHHMIWTDPYSFTA